MSTIDTYYSSDMREYDEQLRDFGRQAASKYASTDVREIVDIQSCAGDRPGVNMADDAQVADISEGGLVEVLYLCASSPTPLEKVLEPLEAAGVYGVPVRGYSNLVNIEEQFVIDECDEKWPIHHGYDTFVLYSKPPPESAFAAGDKRVVSVVDKYLAYCHRAVRDSATPFADLDYENLGNLVNVATHYFEEVATFCRSDLPIDREKTVRAETADEVQGFMNDFTSIVWRILFDTPEAYSNFVGTQIERNLIGGALLSCATVNRTRREVFKCIIPALKWDGQELCGTQELEEVIGGQKTGRMVRVLHSRAHDRFIAEAAFENIQLNLNEFNAKVRGMPGVEDYKFVVRSILDPLPSQHLATGTTRSRPLKKPLLAKRQRITLCPADREVLQCTARDDFTLKENGDPVGTLQVDGSTLVYKEKSLSAAAAKNFFKSTRGVGIGNVFKFEKEAIPARARDVHSICNLVLEGNYGYRAAHWLLCKLFRGGVKVRANAKPSYLHGVSEDNNGLAITAHLSKRITRKLTVVTDGKNVYFDPTGTHVPLLIKRSDGCFTLEPSKLPSENLSYGSITNGLMWE